MEIGNINRGHVYLYFIHSVLLQDHSDTNVSDRLEEGVIH